MVFKGFCLLLEFVIQFSVIPNQNDREWPGFFSAKALFNHFGQNGQKLTILLARRATVERPPEGHVSHGEHVSPGDISRNMSTTYVSPWDISVATCPRATCPRHVPREMPAGVSPDRSPPEAATVVKTTPFTLFSLP